MIECSACKNRVDYNGGICSVCGSAIELTAEDIEAARSELSSAIAKGNSAKIIPLRELLAAAGDTESEREYAKYLERTDSSRRNFDLAMKYYYSAAKKNDPYSAYRYSRLVERTSEVAASFYLRYSAVLGSINAYPDLAELFSSLGREDIASYYLSLAAACDDTPSIVAMAKRYDSGIGVPQNQAYAKWYLDKFTIPPISGVKLAVKLRGIASEVPQKLEFPSYEEYLAVLADEAKEYGYHTAYYKLVSILADTGDLDYQTTLGILTAEGVGTAADGERALGILMTAVMNGSTEAMLYIADGYAKEDGFVPYDIEKALEYYERAAKRGCADAYIKIGDIYRSGKHNDDGIPEPKIALGCYSIGAKLGSSEACEKRDAIIQRRNELYESGTRTLNAGGTVTRREANEAFKALAIAAAYGHEGAPRQLAKCYAFGFGCKASAKDAFFNFLEAAELGDKEAYLSVGLCYARGFGVAFSYKNAIKYLHLAKEAGFSDAEGEITILIKRRRKKAIRAVYSAAMRLIYMKKYDEALKLLSDNEPLGHPKMLYVMGCMYEFGLGTECSRKLSNEYYEKARIGSAALGSFTDEGAKLKSKILKLIKRVG